MNARLKEMPPSRPKVNQVQRRYLNERLTQAARNKDGPKREPMPAELRKAKRRISSWNLAQHRKEVKARNAIRDSRKKVDRLKTLVPAGDYVLTDDMSEETSRRWGKGLFCDFNDIKSVES